ncbi:uncharacterized protein LOC105276316 [Ooceraea biroi]|nr:uncharacterized protein LOC105276316 [Ooceraea biroi]
MRILQLTFKILTFIGCWRPESWSSLYLRMVYGAYTIFMIILLYTFLMSQFLDIIWNVDNAEDFTENLYVMLASVVSCSKMLSLLVNRRNIYALTNILIEKPHKPLQIDEIKIQYKFNKLIQNKTFWYTILVETTCACITMTSLFTEFRKGNLTYRAWLPYNYSSTIVFCFTYAHQLLSLTAGSLVNVACDSLICGLLVHICCQIEILEYRLSKLSRDHDVLRDCVLHHDSIFAYAHKLNNEFRMTIAMQFIVSTMVVCSNLYQMTKSTTANASYLPLLLYMSCMMTQIFIYCWYGNEVKLKSIQLVDNIFAMDWLTLDRNVTRGLLIIMNRATIPIEFTSGYVFSMNLDSFVGILKTSYSAYNILKKMSRMKLEMEETKIMEFTLNVLSVVGVWPPDSWSSSKRAMYNVYSAFITFMLFTFMIPQFLDIILNVTTTDDFADTFYILLAMVMSCFKMTNLLFNRKNIKMLKTILSERPFIPVEADEMEIRRKYDISIHQKTFWYTVMAEVTLGCIAMTSFLTDFRKGHLTYREWTPYNYSETVFCVIYVRQLVSAAMGAMVNIACDSMICGFILHVCCQIEILECRLRKVALNQKNLRMGECVHQHDCIFKYAFMINEHFKQIITIQFIVSMLVVCSNLYQLAKVTLNAESFPLMLYTGSMLTQILIYCWFGNEVKIKSVQLAANIFEIEWLKLDKNSRKDLMIIMTRSLVPIEFSSAYVITMNVDSFVSLLKTSYSAYNVLQQMEMA